MTRRLCFQLLGGFPLSLLRLFNLIRFSFHEAKNCLSKDPAPLLSAELDCRGIMERVQSNSLSNSSIVPVSVALSISTSVRMEMNASNRGSFDIAIHQRLKPSGSVAILEHFTWSSDPRKVEKERLKWLKKGIVCMRVLTYSCTYSFVASCFDFVCLTSNFCHFSASGCRNGFRCSQICQCCCGSTGRRSLCRCSMPAPVSAQGRPPLERHLAGHSLAEACLRADSTWFTSF